MYKNFQASLYFIIGIWLIFFINMILPFDLRIFGIHPRVIYGLWGIAFSPLLHDNYHHIIANSGALFTLFFISLTYNRQKTYNALWVIWVLGGLMVWIFAKTGTVHIGASGIIFGLIGFMLFLGIFRKEWKAAFFSLLVFIFYGGVLLSLLRYSPHISWSGHFFGFLSGVFAAWLIRRK